jgi:Protein of unknown function (DUF2852)
MDRVGSRQAAHPSTGGEDGAEASWNSWDRMASGGNQAFDKYRAETLRRMEVEQEEFAAFVERLRFARDKAEFDQFMAERRTAPGDFGGNPQRRFLGNAQGQGAD